MLTLGFSRSEIAPPSLLSLWCLQRKVPGVGRWTLCVCVMGRVTGTGQAGGHRWRGPGRLMDEQLRQMDPGQWADKMMGSDGLDRFRGPQT